MLKMVKMVHFMLFFPTIGNRKTSSEVRSGCGNWRDVITPWEAVTLICVGRHIKTLSLSFREKGWEASCIWSLPNFSGIHQEAGGCIAAGCR